jgi:hypothetical protein
MTEQFVRHSSDVERADPGFESTTSLASPGPLLHRLGDGASLSAGGLSLRLAAGMRPECA